VCHQPPQSKFPHTFRSNSLTIINILLQTVAENEYISDHWNDEEIDLDMMTEQDFTEELEAGKLPEKVFGGLTEFVSHIFSFKTISLDHLLRMMMMMMTFLRLVRNWMERMRAVRARRRMRVVRVMMMMRRRKRTKMIGQSAAWIRVVNQ
jgi:hypothetical protein